MFNKVRIKHLENPNITTFVNGKQITIRNHQAEVDIEDAKAMMSGPYGYELIGVYDNFIEYVNKIDLNIQTYKQNAPFPSVILGTPIALTKLYCWKTYTESILNLEQREKMHLVFTLDDPLSQWKEEIISWCKNNAEKFYNITTIEWDADKNMAWNRVFKITVGRQLIFNYTRSLHSASHVWFVDLDNVLPIFAYTRLSGYVREASAGLYRFKSVMGGGPVVFDGIGTKTWPPIFIGKQCSDVKPNTGTLECDWTGAGCLLLSRRIFEKYDFNWSKWIQRNGEDAWMCLCAQKETGQKLLVDTSVNCGHIDEQGHIW